MAQVGLRVSEACGLDLDDIKWDLGRFGKLHVRHGKGARGSGPRERMVPLINGADRTLRWFIEDVWGQFDDDHTRPGAPLFPCERKNADGSARRVGDDALRTGLDERGRRSSAGLGGQVDAACPAALLRVPALPGTGWTCSRFRRFWDTPGSPRRCGISTCSSTRVEDAWVAGQQRAAKRLEGTGPMRWNLRLTAANSGIWKASELQRSLAEHGLVISAGKMSGPVVRPAGLAQARRPGRDLRRARLRDRRPADPRTAEGHPPR